MCIYCVCLFGFLIAIFNKKSRLVVVFTLLIKETMSFDKLKKSNTQSNPIDPNKLAELEYTMRTSVGSLIGGLDVIAA